MFVYAVVRRCLFIRGNKSSFKLKINLVKIRVYLFTSKKENLQNEILKIKNVKQFRK